MSDLAPGTLPKFDSRQLCLAPLGPCTTQASMAAYGGRGAPTRPMGSRGQRRQGTRFCQVDVTRGGTRLGPLVALHSRILREAAPITNGPMLRAVKSCC